jgi:hypothetical protein
MMLQNLPDVGQKWPKHVVDVERVVLALKINSDFGSQNMHLRTDLVHE